MEPLLSSEVWEVFYQQQRYWNMTRDGEMKQEGAFRCFELCRILEVTELAIVLLAREGNDLPDSESLNIFWHWTEAIESL